MFLEEQTEKIFDLFVYLNEAVTDSTYKHWPRESGREGEAEGRGRGIERRKWGEKGGRGKEKDL